MTISLLLMNEKIKGVQIEKYSISLEKLNKSNGGKKLYKYLKENQDKVKTINKKVFELDSNTDLLEKSLNDINKKILHKQSFSVFMDNSKEFIDKCFYINRNGEIGYKESKHKFTGAKRYLSNSRLNILNINKSSNDKHYIVQYNELTGSSSRDTIEDCRSFAYFDKKDNLLGEYNLLSYKTKPCLALTKDKKLVLFDENKPNKPVTICKGIEFNLNLCHIYKITNKKQLFVYYKNYNGKDDDGEFTSSVFYIYEIEDGQSKIVYKQKNIMDEVDVYKEGNKLIVYESRTDNKVSFSVKEEIFEKDYIENKMYKKIMHKEK